MRVCLSVSLKSSLYSIKPKGPSSIIFLYSSSSFFFSYSPLLYVLPPTSLLHFTYPLLFFIPSLSLSLSLYPRAPTGGAAEMLAQDLCNSLRENLSPRGAAQALFAVSILSLILAFISLPEFSPSKSLLSLISFLNPPSPATSTSSSSHPFSSLLSYISPLLPVVFSPLTFPSPHSSLISLLSASARTA